MSEALGSTKSNTFFYYRTSQSLENVNVHCRVSQVYLITEHLGIGTPPAHSKTVRCLEKWVALSSTLAQSPVHSSSTTWNTKVLCLRVFLQ